MHVYSVNQNESECQREKQVWVSVTQYLLRGFYIFLEKCTFFEKICIRIKLEETTYLLSEYVRNIRKRGKYVYLCSFQVL